MIKKFNPIFSLLILFFFFSGASWLMYEIISREMLNLIFGISNLDIATALSSFLAGLALGSWFFGKRADVTKRPLRFYALLEIGIALFVVVFPHTLDAIKLVYLLLQRHFEAIRYMINILEFLFCFSVVIIPAALMGGTLPIAVRCLTTGPTLVGNRLGSLYGVNTLGAAAGCIAVGFLHASRGVTETLNIAAAINLAIGMLAFLVDARLSSARLKPLPENDNRIRLSLSPYPLHVRTTIPIIACISGFCALAYEMLWARALAFYIQSSIYSFPIILAAILAGTALGSIISIIFADRQSYSLVFIGVIQLLIGISFVVTILAFSSISARMAELWSTQSVDWLSPFQNGFVVYLIIVFIPILSIGMILPLVCRVYAHSINQTGKGVGSIYAIYTVGAVLGLFVPGFVLIPLIGATKAILAVFVMNILAGTIVLVLRYYPRRKFRYGIVAAGLIIVAAGAAIIIGTAPISF